MKYTSACFQGVALAVAMTAIPTAVSGQAPPLEAPSVEVRLEQVTTARTGGSKQGGFASISLATNGETQHLLVYSGGDACSAGVGASKAVPVPIPEVERFAKKPVAEYSQIEVRRVSATIDNVSLELKIHRESRGPDGKLRVAGDERRVITLAEGEPHVIAYVDGGPESAGCHAANAIFQITASIKSDDEARQLLVFDVWLVHDDGQGTRSSEHSHVTAVGPTAGRVNFPPLTWPLPNTACTVQVEVVAELRGRSRSDGLIDVSVEPQRSIRLMFSSQPGSNAFGRPPGSGRKTLTLKPNEAVELVLPPELAGRLTDARCGGAKSGLDVGTFFQGHKTSVILKVRAYAIRPLNP
jgi:hypothetical protein